MTKFNNFYASRRENGWNPNLVDDANFIVRLAQANQVMRPYLMQNLGGKDNKTNDKCIGAFRRFAKAYLADCQIQGARATQPATINPAPPLGERMAALPPLRPAAVAATPVRPTTLLNSLFLRGAASAGIAEEENEDLNDDDDDDDGTLVHNNDGAGNEDGEQEDGFLFCGNAGAGDDDNNEVVEPPMLAYGNKRRSTNSRSNGVDFITRKMEYAMSNWNHFVCNCSQKLPIVTWSWEDGEAQATYITIRVELLGTIWAQDILASIINNGERVKC